MAARLQLVYTLMMAVALPVAIAGCAGEEQRETAPSPEAPTVEETDGAPVIDVPLPEDAGEETP